jgi:purine-binding chemotaxis protein CheW
MTEMTSRVPWLSFSLQGECYVHDVACIKSIVLYEQPQEVPGAPEGMVGILNVRGEPVSIYSGRQLLGLLPQEVGPQWRIVLFDVASGSFGLIVDSVDALVHLSHDEIDRTDHQTDSELIVGTVHHDNTLMIALDCTHTASDWLSS